MCALVTFQVEGQLVMLIIKRMHFLTCNPGHFTEIQKHNHYLYCIYLLTGEFQLKGINIYHTKNVIKTNRRHLYHRIYSTLENKTPTTTFPKFPLALHVIDRSDSNPPIEATSVTFQPSLCHAIGLWLVDFDLICQSHARLAEILEMF